jgi:hypothetical protein
LGRKAVSTARTSPEVFGVIAKICGLHAQVMSSAGLTLWARVEDLEPGMVGEALWEHRSLVKTWVMRGTLHLLPADELPTWVAAQGILKPRHYTKSWQKHYGLTYEEAEDMLAAIREALDGRIVLDDGRSLREDHPDKPCEGLASSSRKCRIPRFCISM